MKYYFEFLDLHYFESVTGGLLYSFGGILLPRFFLMSYSLVDVCTFKKAVTCTRIYIMISVGKAFHLWVGEHWNVLQGAKRRGMRWHWVWEGMRLFGSGCSRSQHQQLCGVCKCCRGSAVAGMVVSVLSSASGSRAWGSWPAVPVARANGVNTLGFGGLLQVPLWGR